MMKRIIKNVKSSLAISMIMLFFLFPSACSLTNKDTDTGTLQGNVTIGPLCPVEPCNISREHIDSAYSVRKVMVYAATDTARLIQQVDVFYDSLYSVTLKPGIYIVDINHIGIDRSGDVPAKVTIEPGKMAVLDIDIDTGIR